MIRIGCSGWSYRHWRGAFYPKGMTVKQWFAHYAATFDTVEVNASFYRLPAPETFEQWRDQSPQGFCYAVKAPRYITHMHKLKDPGTRFLDAVQHLSDRLGPVLYQLPPRWHCDPDRLEQFLKSRPTSLTHVFEFRDVSWIDEAILALLERYDASFCVHDMPGSATPRWAAGPVAYIRFHGGTKVYSGDYSDAELRDWRDWIVEQHRGGRSVWAFFNNDLEARALDCARRLQTFVDEIVR